MINLRMALLVEELHDEGMDDPLAQPIMLAALWSDLCRQAGEQAPAVLDHYLADGFSAGPAPGPMLADAVTGRSTGTGPIRARSDAASQSSADELPTIQDLYFALMAKSSFNDFDGPQVVRDLQARPELWHAVLIVSSNLEVQLRDLPLDVNQADTLYIATDERHVAAVEGLAERWFATTVERYQPGLSLDFGGWPRGDIVLRLWWD